MEANGIHKAFVIRQVRVGLLNQLYHDGLIANNGNGQLCRDCTWDGEYTEDAYEHDRTCCKNGSDELRNNMHRERDRTKTHPGACLLNHPRCGHASDHEGEYECVRSIRPIWGIAR